MVSLCLTNPKLNGVVHKPGPQQSKKADRARRKHRDENTNMRSVGSGPDELVFNEKGKTSAAPASSFTVDLTGLTEPSRSFEGGDTYPKDSNRPSRKLNREVLEQRRETMLKTLHSMGGGLTHRRGWNARNRHQEKSHKQQQFHSYAPDARKDPYRVHKWRVKSGRVLNLGQIVKKNSSGVKVENDTEGHRQPHQQEPREEHFHPGARQFLPTVHQHSKKRASLSKFTSALQTVQEAREELFSLPKLEKQQRPLPYGRPPLDHTMINRLRHNMRWAGSDKVTSRRNVDEAFHVSDFSSPDLRYDGSVAGLDIRKTLSSYDMNQTKDNSTSLAGRHHVRLPPIKARFQRRQHKMLDIKEKTTADRKASLIKGSRKSFSEEPSIPEERYIPGRKQSADDRDERPLRPLDAKSRTREGSLGHSPSRLIASTSSTSGIAGVAPRARSKEADTPTDSEGSFGNTRFRRLKRLKTLKSLGKQDGKGNSPIYRHVKPKRLDALMWKWYIAMRLAVWLSRLCKCHRLMVDDIFNIRSGTTNEDDDVTAESGKREVLFDLTDYKMKNQLRLSDTTRRILTMSPSMRSDKEINLVQASLRNIKAVSDYATAVQKQIGRHGYFVGFDDKRIVVREGRRPLNYYILLAGSAVVIKEDESGKTNPVQLMRRGDVFGEHEILEDIPWRWTVVTTGQCEFLLLTREMYRNIFITGGGGGLFADPDRGKFLRSISLLQHWPTELLNENPNRCLFRYFKRGALLVRDDSQTEWIYVIKSGSCSVMKMLMVDHLSKGQIVKRLAEEQRFSPEIKLTPRLVPKSEATGEADHLQALKQKEEEEQNKANEASVYQQLEMSTVLKELNPDVIGLSASPNADIDEYDHRTEFPMSSFQTEDTKCKAKPNPPYDISNDEEASVKLRQAHDNLTNGFRLSRHSDRRDPRTPSPMKAAYLRTGPTPLDSRQSNGGADEATRTQLISFDDELGAGVGVDDDLPTEGVITNVELHPPNQTSHQQPVDVSSIFLSTISPAATAKSGTNDNLHPTHINVRKLTAGEVFGIGTTLYANQPSLALVSNGAECLMLNKKFYLENASEECLRSLREALSVNCAPSDSKPGDAIVIEFPYPSEEELMQQHWRLVAWKAYQSNLLGEVLERQNDMKVHRKETTSNHF